MPFEKGKSGNPNGRPKGSRNKVNAERDIMQAMASGMSLQDLVKLLSDKIQDEEVNETQRSKYLKMLVDLRLELSRQSIKLDSDKTPKKDKSTSPKPVAEVSQFPSPKIKRG